MKESLRIVIVLTVFSILSGGILGWFNKYTEKRVALNNLTALQESLKAVTNMNPKIEAYESVVKEKGFELYKIFSGTETVAYAIVASGNGFQDKIKLIFGVKPDFSRIIDLRILEQKETPGMGAKIETKKYLEQWKGKGADSTLELVKKKPNTKYQVEAITGATVSSTSVLNIVNRALDRARKAIKEAEK